MNTLPIRLRALLVLAVLVSLGSMLRVAVVRADVGDRPILPQPHYPKRPSYQYQTSGLPSVGPAPSLYVKWTGASGGGCGGAAQNPPDPHGAAGPSGLIATVNRSVSYYGRDGSSRWSIASGDFMSPSGATGLIVDAKCLYDAQSGRFYVVGSENYLHSGYYTVIAVSRASDPITSGTASWYFYRLNTAQTDGSRTYGGDYPCLGVDHQCLYVALNMFSLPIDSSSIYRNVQVISCDKSQLNSGTAVYTRLNTPNTPGDIRAAFTLQPASLVGSTTAGNVGYLAEIPYCDDDSLRLWAISDPLGTPTLSSTLIPIPSNGGGFGGSGAPQGGTPTQRLDTVSPRAMGNAFWREGNLWLCCTAGRMIGDSTASVFYYRLTTNSYPSGTPTLSTSGNVDGGSGVWRFMPSIAGNALGDVCLTFTQSSASTYPSVMATIQQAGSDGFPEPVTILTSPSYFNSTQWYDCNVPISFGRWGDYSGATVDPLDSSFWVCDEYANGTSGGNLWGVEWANLRFDATTAWQTDGVPVRSSTTTAESARIIPDGSGGTLVAWADSRLPESQPYIKRLTSTGNTASGWPPAGLLLSDQTLYPANDMHLVADGSGGAFVSFVSGSFGGQNATYLQHVSASGGIASGWPSAGIAIDVTTATGLIGDGVGGVILGWSDANGEFRAQRYDAGGNDAWASGGVVLGAEAASIALVSDGQGGAIGVWGPTLSAQRISSAGVVQWSAGGVSLGAAARATVAVADGSGGAFIGYHRDVAGTTDPIYALRITASGANAAGWPSGGMPCTQVVYQQSQPAIVTDGTGGVICAWRDHRSSTTDIFAQRLTGSGAYAAGWSSSGTIVAAPAGFESQPVLVGDGAGGALFTWDDARGTYCQHILGSGARDLSYAADGNAVCAAAGDQRFPVVALASAGAAVLAWADGRVCGTSCTSAIYAQQQLFDAIAPAAIDDLTISGCSMSGILLSWTAPADNTGGPVASYEIRYSGSPIDDANWVNASIAAGSPGPLPPGSTQTFWVNGLSPCTWKYFVVKSQDIVGNYSVVSNNIHARTKCTSSGPCLYDDGNPPNIVRQADDENEGPVSEVVIVGVHPNPSTFSVEFEYEVPMAMNNVGDLSIYDLAGRHVATILREPLNGGRAHRVWDLRSGDGKRVSSGLYWVRLQMGGECRTKIFVVQ